VEIPHADARLSSNRFRQLPPRRAQHTARLTEVFRLIGYLLGGNSGERHCVRLGMEVSSDTFLRRLKVQTNTCVEFARVLGVGDWAWPRGQRYGALLVDLQRHRIVDVLPDRTADTVKCWLERHPEIEVISRDRADAYVEVAKEGAPDAVQVADRFHLICNLSAAIERVLKARMPQILSASNAKGRNGRARKQ
jgi:transposase